MGEGNSQNRVYYISNKNLGTAQGTNMDQGWMSSYHIKNE